MTAVASPTTSQLLITLNALRANVNLKPLSVWKASRTVLHEAIEKLTIVVQTEAIPDAPVVTEEPKVEETQDEKFEAFAEKAYAPMPDKLDPPKAPKAKKPAKAKSTPTKVETTNGSTNAFTAFVKKLGKDPKVIRQTLRRANVKKVGDNWELTDEVRAVLTKKFGK